MKKILSLLTLSLIIQCSFGQKETTASSEIKNVTVFLSGAEVHRTAKTQLSSGSNVITFENLSPYISANSIQVKAKSKNVTIVSVNHQSNYLSDNKNDKKLQMVKDSIEDLNFSKSIRLGHQRVYQEEKSLLITNKSIKGDQTGVDVEDLMDMADFYRTRLLELETKLLDIELQLTDINATLARLNQQRNLLSKGTTKHTNEIVVNCSSESSATVQFEISYVITQASWVPKYDIRSTDISEPVELTYKADVYNYSGYDWNDVNITLSSGNPSIDNTQPTLTTWYLQYYQNHKAQYKSSYGGAPKSRKASATAWEDVAVSDEESNDDSFKWEEEKSTSLADFTQMIESNINTEFKINVPYTIKSDGKPYLVEIQKYELPVDYSYMSIPKKDKDAFLLGRISGWGGYNLLPGDANVYFEGTFVGNSYLETSTTLDTLDVSLGRDKGIVIQRKKIDEFCKNTTFGGNHKTSRGYEISIRNNKSKPVTIKLLDQLPLSSNKDVEVTVDNLGGAERNEQNGELKWNLTIPAGETKKVEFKFTVKYPKDYNISNL